MTNIPFQLADRLRNESGFVIGRVALVVLILAIVIMAALIALIVPN
jgi:hypothetical protein